MSTLGILNVGAGDTKLSFDKSNPVERIRAARIVKDMIRRGYALLIEVDDGKGGTTHRRAIDFDENVCEYIIADFDSVQAEDADLKQRVKHGQGGEAEEGEKTAGVGHGVDTWAPVQPKRRGRPPTKRIPAEKARGVAVARTAGG